MAKRAAVYVRLSRHRGAEDPSTSPERQREACEQYAAAQGWTVVRVIEDLDVSGSEKGERLDRPGLQVIRGLWGQVDVVLFLKLDRLARSVVDFHAFAQEAREHGADLVSVRDGLDLTTPSGRFVATILAAFAEMEAATIAERTREGLRGAALQGRWTGGPAPYGYRSVPHPAGRGRALDVEPLEAAALREAAEMVLEGQPAAAVARWMTAHAPPPRRTAYWSRMTLRQVLTGEAALGRLVVGGKVLRGPDGYPLTPFPAIFTPAEGAALREALAITPNGRPRRATGGRLLSGLLTCSGCGRVMTASDRAGDVALYRCHVRGHGGRCPRSVAASAPAVEGYVEGEFLAAFGRLPMRERRVTEADTAALDAVEEAIAATLAELATAATPETFARLQALQSERDRLAALPADRSVEWVDLGRTVAEEWAARDVAGRRAMLADAVGVMELRPGRQGRKGFDPDRLLLEWAS